MPEATVSAIDDKNKYFPMGGTYKYVRNAFWQAGQDSYTLPPAQDPDMFMQLSNVNPVMRGTLDRRWGYQSWANGNALNLNYMRMAGYRIDATQGRYVAAVAGGSSTQQAQIDIYNEDGTLHQVNIGNIVSYQVMSGSVPYVIDSRDYLYLLINGAANLFRKYDGANVTIWGTPAPSGVITLLGAGGPPAPGLATNAPTAITQTPFGSKPWSGLSNINGASPTNTNPCLVSLAPVGGGADTSYELNVAGFGFAVPAGSTIQGVQVFVGREQSSGTSAIYDAFVQLRGTGITPGPNRHNGSPWARSEETIEYGGTTDTWGATGLTAATVNDPSFGLTFSANCTHGPGNGGIGDVFFVSMAVYWQEGGSGGGAGNLTLSVGRQYCGVYRSSVSQHISSPTAFTDSTGPLTNQTEGLQLPGPISDAQFDWFDILATSDGGDQTTLYLLASVPVAQTTYTDNTPETDLLNSTIYQQNDANGLPHGCVNNINPDNSTFIGIKHRGRLYLFAGHTVFFSKNIDELTTLGAGDVPFIAGRWEESFPPTYLFDVSEWAETLTGGFSDGVTLYMATERSIRRLIGDGPQNYQKPEIVFNETGVLNQEVWKPVFKEGQPIGTMWLTPDFRVILSDMNTYQDVGHPIQDVLNSINTATAAGTDNFSVAGTVSQQTSRATFVSIGAYDLYVLAVATGSNTLPDTLLIYNLRTSRWTVWKPADTTTAIFFNIDGAGRPQFLFSAGVGTNVIAVLYQYLPSLTQDRSNTIAVNIPLTVQTSWLDLGDPMLRKALNMSSFITSDPTNILLTVEGARTAAEFVSPQLVVANAPLVSGPLGDTNVYLAGKITKYQWYRFTYTDNGNSVGSLAVGSSTHEVVPIHRVT